MLRPVLLMYYKAGIKFDVICHLVFLLNVVQRQDVGNTIRIVPDSAITLQITFLCLWTYYRRYSAVSDLALGHRCWSAFFHYKTCLQSIGYQAVSSCQGCWPCAANCIECHLAQRSHLHSPLP